MRRGILGFALMFGIVGIAQSGLGAVEFDYSKESDSRVVSFEELTKVVLVGVNTLDYEYDVTIDAIPVAPQAPSMIGFRPASEKGSEKPEVIRANACLLARRLLFGESELKAWEETVLESWDPELKALLIPSDSKPGRKEIPQVNIERAVVGRNEGMLLRIIVEAHPKETTISSSTEKGKTTYQLASNHRLNEDEATMLADAQEKVKKHMPRREYFVRTKIPKHVITSVGPFLHFLERREYDQIRNPDFQQGSQGDDEYIIGTTEDSDLGYGIGAFWSVRMFQCLVSPKVPLRSGPTWGVAYTPEQELDQSVCGLMGWHFGWRETPALLHAGAAIGQVSDLSGREVGDPIGVDEEIPLSHSTELSFFFALGFHF